MPESERGGDTAFGQKSSILLKTGGSPPGREPWPQGSGEWNANESPAVPHVRVSSAFSLAPLSPSGKVRRNLRCVAEIPA